MRFVLCSVAYFLFSGSLVDAKSLPANVSRLDRDTTRPYSTNAESFSHVRQQCQPNQVHITVGQDASSSMTISFAVPRQCQTLLAGMKVYVVVGEQPLDLSRIVFPTGNPREYQYMPPNIYTHNRGNTIVNQTTAGDHESGGVENNRIDSVPSMYYSDYYYHIEIDSLIPCKRYYYRCVVDCIASESENEHSSEHPPGFELRGSLSNGDFLNDADKFVLSTNDGQEASPHSSTSESGDLKNSNSSVMQRQSTASAKANMRLLFHKSRIITSMSNIGTFKTAPIPGSFDQSVKFVFVGDVGTSSRAETTIRHMITYHHRSPISSLLLVGDISYANSNQPVWDRWFRTMEPLISNVPMQTAPGNHEIEVDGRTHEVYVPYDARFAMPQVQRGSKLPSWTASIHGGYKLIYEFGNAFYAYTYGAARFIILSSFSVCDEGSVQYNWVKQELGSIDRTILPWVFVAFHVPLYNTFTSHEHDRSGEDMKTAMEPLFVRYGVNIIFSGHVHSFMRTKPIIEDGLIDPRGPRHIIIGDGGQGNGSHFARHAPEAWVAKRDELTHGFGTIRLENQTHAHWTWIRNVNEKFSTVHDSVWLENQFFQKK